MTDTTAVAAVQRIISEGRTKPSGTRTETPGTDAVNQRVRVNVPDVCVALELFFIFFFTASHILILA